MDVYDVLSGCLGGCPPDYLGRNSAGLFANADMENFVRLLDRLQLWSRGFQLVASSAVVDVVFVQTRFVFLVAALVAIRHHDCKAGVANGKSAPTTFFRGEPAGTRGTLVRQ